MSKYDTFNFVGNNQAINRVRVGSSKMRNRGAFLGSLASLLVSLIFDKHWFHLYLTNTGFTYI